MMLSALVVPASNLAPDMDVGGELIRIVFTLAGVIGLIFAAGWFSRRMQIRPGQARRLRVVDAINVGTKDRVVLLDADGKRLLLGIGQGGVRTLHVYDKDVSMDELPEHSKTPFKEVLNQWKGKK
jgi:flagellar protein FliO/FliZ